MCRPVPEMDPMHSSCSCLGPIFCTELSDTEMVLKSKCLLKANSITTVVNFFKCGDWSFLRTYSGECAGILTELLCLWQVRCDRDPEEPEGL